MAKLRGLVVLSAVLALTGLVQGAASASADVRTGEVAVVSSDKAPKIDLAERERQSVLRETAGRSPVTPLSEIVTLAGAGCGSVCNGKNPATYNVCTRLYGAAACAGGEVIYCGDSGQTIDLVEQTNGLWAELRYSPVCRTAWAKSYHATATTAASSWIEGTGSSVTYYRATSAGVAFTAMVNDAGYTARAGVRYCSVSLPCYDAAYTIWY